MEYIRSINVCSTYYDIHWSHIYTRTVPDRPLLLFWRKCRAPLLLWDSYLQLRGCPNEGTTCRTVAFKWNPPSSPAFNLYCNPIDALIIALSHAVNPTTAYWVMNTPHIYIPQDDRYILIDLQLLHHRMEQEEPKNCCWWQHAPSWLFQMDMCTLLLLISSIQFEQECILFWKEQVERICCFGKEQELAHTRVERIIYIASMDELISIQIS